MVCFREPIPLRYAVKSLSLLENPPRLGDDANLASPRPGLYTLDFVS